MSVYFIQNTRTKSVKIGSSNDPRSRVCQLQTGCPDRLALLGFAPGGSSLEHEIHRRFAQYRECRDGEWFRGHPDLLAAIRQIIVTQAAADNLWEAFLRRRNKWRHDLPGINVRHVETGKLCTIVNTRWDVDSHFLIEVFLGPESGWYRAEQFVLEEELPSSRRRRTTWR